MWRQWRRWLAYPLLWLTLMLIPMLISLAQESFGAAAETNKILVIRRFDATYEPRVVGDRLTIQVTERIRADFLRPYINHGIERRLPTTYGDTKIDLTDIDVTTPEGFSIPWGKRRGDHDETILRIGSSSTYVTGPVDYVITYTIGNGMVAIPDRNAQAIYLDVNGTGWLQPFDEVSATVVIPPPLADRLTGGAACFRGRAGATDPCLLSVQGTTATASVTGLGPRENLTIALDFRPDTVTTTVPLPTSASWGWWGLALLPGVGLLLLGVALIARRVQQRPQRWQDADVTFTPPDDPPPLVIADFLGVPERGAAAQLAALAVSGTITIRSAEHAIGTAAQRRESLSALERHELTTGFTTTMGNPDHIQPESIRRACIALFGKSGVTRPLGEQPPSDEIAIATELRRNLLSTSGLRHPTRLPRHILVMGMLALIVLGWVQLARTIPGLGWAFLACGVLGVMLVVAATHYSPPQGRLTQSGRLLMTKLSGLRRFVTMAEAERIAWMQNAVDAPRVRDGEGSRIDLYEPLLPFAVLLGVEDTWADLLGAQYDTLGGRARSERGTLGRAIRLLATSDQGPSTTTQGLVTDHDTWWSTRPEFGHGGLSTTWTTVRESIAERWDRVSTSGSDDSGGSWWSSDSSSSSSSSSGSSGGGMGGGGGGGW